MQIICKYKDFYDYKCYEFGRDPFPTFERRECVKLTQSSLVEWLIKFDGKEYCFTRNQYDHLEYFDIKNVWFYLEVGSDKYIFLATNITRKQNFVVSIPYYYDCSVELVRVIKNTKKIWPSVMTLSRIEIKNDRIRNPSFGGLSFHPTYNGIKKGDERYFNYGNESDHFGRINKDKIIKLPILSSTKLAGVLDPQEIYAGIDSYLRSLQNDVNTESEGLTDVEKAVNKGFNKRESFRNIHPRT